MIFQRRQNPPNAEFRSEADDSFTGVNMKLAPDQLPPGICALAINKTLRRAIAETRAGVRTPAQFNPRFPVNAGAGGDSLHVVVTWDADNGADLRGLLTVLIPQESTTVAQTLDNEDEFRENAGPNPYLAAMASAGNRLEFLVDGGRLDYQYGVYSLTGSPSADLGLYWYGAAADGAVQIAVTAYSGGTWTRDDVARSFTNTGGTAGPTRSFTHQLYTSEHTSAPASASVTGILSLRAAFGRTAAMTRFQIQIQCPDASALASSGTASYFVLPSGDGYYASNLGAGIVPSIAGITMHDVPCTIFDPATNVTTNFRNAIFNTINQNDWFISSPDITVAHLSPGPVDSVSLITQSGEFTLLNPVVGETAPTYHDGTLAAGPVFTLSELRPAAADIPFGTTGWLTADPGILEAVLRVGTYTDAAGLEWKLLATRLAIYQVREDRAPVRWDLPFEVTNPGDFLQFAGSTLLLREDDQVPLVWDGVSDWAELAQVEPGNGTRLLPNAAAAEIISNRVAVPYQRDYVVVSDVLSFEYDDQLAIFAINQGAEDGLVRILPFTKTSLLCFKARSLYLLENITGDLTSVQLTDLSREIGLAAPRAVARVGGDVYFLARTGVFKVSQVSDSRYAADSVALSEPVEPFFRDRVNWSAIAGAQAIALQDYFYLAVPIDRSTGNNALLCYNLASQQWEGWHTLPGGYCYDHLFIAEVRSRRRLFAADATTGAVLLLGEGVYDQILGTRYEISDELLTRAYSMSGYGEKVFTAAAVDVQTFAPSFTVKVEAEGVNEVLALDTRTKDRTKYTTQGTPAWDPSNTNNDHANPKREDYSVILPESGGLKIGTNGIALNLKQRSVEKYAFSDSGRAAQIRIVNTTGQCDLHKARLEARHCETLTRTGT